jgi:hypothetical protein
VTVTKQRITGPHLRDLLLTKGVRNDHDLVGDTGGKIPYVTFRNGRKKRNVVSAWQVKTPGRRTDPDGRFADDFDKTFLVSEKGVLATPDAAKLWASETYGVHDWVKTPFGSWTSKERLDARLRELLPQFFDPDYRDPTAQKIVAKLYGDDQPNESMYRVVVQLYAKPEPPLYVIAADEDAARRQVTQLFTKLAGTRVLDGLKLSVYDA